VRPRPVPAVIQKNKTQGTHQAVGGARGMGDGEYRVCSGGGGGQGEGGGGRESRAGGGGGGEGGGGGVLGGGGEESWEGEGGGARLPWGGWGGVTRGGRGGGGGCSTLNLTIRCRYRDTLKGGQGGHPSWRQLHTMGKWERVNAPLN